MRFVGNSNDMIKLNLLIFTIFSSLISLAQPNFDYTLELTPVTIPGMQGLHSYAFGQHEGKWLIIGGRRDGLHARQPFNAFPANQNNTQAYVIDVENQQFWVATLSVLPVSIFEQLQSTNMNFVQSADTLYIIGGYAFSETADDHITFPNLTTVVVSEVVDAIINQNDITQFFQQIEDDHFAVCGGQLGRIGETFYLVGGHRFDGRYNPMGNPTYTQTYTSQIRKFEVNNSDNALSYNNYEEITDPVHLRRRDFNLLPQIFPDGSEGFTISSGVFQIDDDLPYLYPVDITANGYTPNTGFNQYLSNYHSATAWMFDAEENVMHNIFFGGMSQYYYQDGELIQDDLVPFVRTISRLSRDSEGNLYEFQMPIEMPGLKGASAEFIPNQNMPHFDSEVIKLDEIEPDTFVIGHVFGGVLSPTLNPFSVNQTNTTSADASIYEVKLIKQVVTNIELVNGSNPYDFEVFPNPATSTVNLYFTLKKPGKVNYLISSVDGKLLDTGRLVSDDYGDMVVNLDISGIDSTGVMMVTLIFEGKYFVTKRVLRN
jgi:hypothetical protein